MTKPENRVVLDQDGIERMFAAVAAKLEKADTEIRAEWAGKPAAQVVPVADEILRAAGIPLSGDDLAAYAASVELREPFQINLG